MTEKAVGPRALAVKSRAGIAELEQKIAAATDRQEKKRLRQSLSLQRDTLKWLETRRGY
jgi:hypothetical protein